ncbi:MAG: TetR/AcrR family transcriptional regulator [Variovorax sp.]|nr:MAG: TetR/AcrR family transcriptional regulator [Variovorax sp.]
MVSAKMDSMLNFGTPSMPPLPEALVVSLSASGVGLLKRERTRVQLVQAAIRVFIARGYGGATMQEVGAAAGVTTGTVYNHFKTKEEIARGVALLLGETLCQRISDSQQGITDGAQRMAIGIQRYIWLAEESPPWALLMLEVAAAAPELVLQIAEYARADMRMGVKQKTFRIPNEWAAMDVVNGSVTQAIRSVVMGLAPPNHGRDVAACVLRALGMPFEDAQKTAYLPLPPFPAEMGAPPARAKALPVPKRRASKV